MKSTILKIRTFLFLNIFLLSSINIFAESPIQDEWDRVVKLKGYWKFAIGDYPEWSSDSFNDDDWETIRVPSNWEDQGYYDYDGYAWYRTQFEIDEIFNGENLYLNLGYIDDVDEVYINGVLIGFSGIFPPNYITAYNAKRLYNIPKNLLRYNGENTIAVRVYDVHLEGGIIKGDIGIFRNFNRIHPEIQLAGLWKFKIGDNQLWSDSDYDDSEWEDLMVPGFWKYYGYKDYDGYGWYRKKFAFNFSKSSKFVLVLGKIDDIDEVYLNGKLVGSTGDMENETFTFEEYKQLRVYYLNGNDLLYNQKNTIAVRVLDGQFDGGIYEGPVGIMKLKTFQEFWKEQKRSPQKGKNIWEKIFN